MARVSVIITCYNLGTYLQEALDSVFAQDFPDIEVLVVDDGSTEQSTLEVLAYLAKDTRLRLLQIANQGVAQARNAGIRSASGAYLLPLDADDRIHPSYVRRAAEILDTHAEVGFVGCHYRLFEDYQAVYAPEQYRLPDLLIENVVPVTSLFRRTAWEQVGGYCTDIAIEDWDFWLSLIDRGCVGWVIPDILFDHRMRSSSRHTDNQKPEAYQRTMAMLYQRHRRLYDRYTREVLAGKDLEYAKTLAHGMWLEQQWQRWEQVANERQAAMQHMGVRSRLVGQPWILWSLAHWRRVRSEHPTVFGQAGALAKGARRVMRRKLRRLFGM